jgi:ubiquinone/menaquinone biosynthesis C-methylase UbiE
MPTNESHPHVSAFLCPWWLGCLLDNPLRRCLHDPHAILGRWVKPGQRAADVGAGTGFFSLPLCELVGETGKIYAVDLQPGMLRQIERKAARRHLLNLVTCQSDERSFALPERVDFILVFWMLHEVAKPDGFLQSIKASLNDGGTVLFSEPKFHVTQSTFLRETALFTAAGFRIRETVSIRASRSLLLEKV